MKGIASILIFTVLVNVCSASPQGRSGVTRQRQGTNRQTSQRKVDLMKYRLDVDTNNYIRVGTTDKCPENMRFFAIDGNETAGMCDCDYYQCSRPSIYSTVTKKCHFAWSQGPCQKSEWFVFDEQLTPKCEPRACAQGLADEPVTIDNVSLHYWFKNPKNGQCYEAGSEGDCENEDETLLISPGEPIPECRSVSVCVPLGTPAPQLCFPGNRRTHLGLCPNVK